MICNFGSKLCDMIQAATHYKLLQEDSFAENHGVVLAGPNGSAVFWEDEFEIVDQDEQVQGGAQYWASYCDEEGLENAKARALAHMGLS